MSPLRLLALLALVAACDQPAAPESRPPDEPAGVLTGARTEQIIITWKDVANEASFRIEVRSGDGPWMLLTETAPNITSAVHSGVIHGQQYFYRVAACNSAGCSKWVETGGRWDTGAPPSSVVFSVTQLGTAHATLRATARTGGLPTRFTFILVRARDLTPAYYSEPVIGRQWIIGGEAGELALAEISVFGLLPNTEYQLLVTASNNAGPALTPAKKSFSTYPVSPPSFSGPHSLASALGSALLYIAVLAYGSPTLYYFEIASENADFSEGQRTDLRPLFSPYGVGPYVVNATIPLPPGNYKWRAIARNEVGESVSETYSITMPAR